jgi:hypothetical protein
MAEAGVALGWDVLHLPARGLTTDQVVRVSAGCDLFIWARTHGHYPEGDLHGMLRRIEDSGTPTVGVHFDLYWGLGTREDQIGVDPWWSHQFVFTADGGHQAEFAARGVNHYWMPPALGHRWLGAGRPSPAFGALDAVFTGSNLRAIHGEHRRQLLDWATTKWGRSFRMFGGMTQVWGADLSHLCASTRTVLGDSAPADRYWSDRVPSVLGRGGLLAHPNTVGFEGQGITGEVAVLFDRFDFAGLGDQLSALTDHDRTTMRQNALDLVRDRHLFIHRLQQIQEVVFQCG